MTARCPVFIAVTATGRCVRFAAVKVAPLPQGRRVSWIIITPDRDVLASQLHDFVQAERIVPTVEGLHWQSGAYAVVLPTLQRFEERSALENMPTLRFSEFIGNVDQQSPGPERFNAYAKTVMGNRQCLSGRSKIEVAYEGGLQDPATLVR
jgi:hypothetical protein